MPHHGLAAHQSHLQRLVPVHQRKHALHQLVAALVAQLAQRHLAAQVVFAVGVAARAAQGALARDLD
jgi:hypothetical protein